MSNCCNHTPGPGSVPAICLFLAGDAESLCADHWWVVTQIHAVGMATQSLGDEYAGRIDLCSSTRLVDWAGETMDVPAYWQARQLL